MPSYVRTRLLSAREYALNEIESLKDGDDNFSGTVIGYIRQFVPFENYYFSGVDLDNCQTGNGIFLATDIAGQALREYGRRGLMRIDPAVAAVNPGATEVDWHDIDEAVIMAPEVAPLRLYFSEFQLAPRLIFTFWNNRGELYGSAGFLRKAPFSECEKAVLRWSSKKLHDDMSRRIMEAFNTQVGLSSSEMRCIECASRGETSAEISATTGLSVETVNSHIKSATKKLRAQNRTQAIADAIRLGLIK